MNCNTNHHTIQSVAPKKTTTLLALSSVSIGTTNAFENSDHVQHAEQERLESLSFNTSEPPRDIILSDARRNKIGLGTKTNHTTQEGPSKGVYKTVFGKMASIAIAMLVIGCCFSVNDHNLIVQSHKNANADPQADVSRAMKIDVQRETDEESETAEEKTITGGEVESEEENETIDPKTIDPKTIIDALEKAPKDDKTITFSSLLPANAATLPKNH
eukprot:458656_1